MQHKCPDKMRFPWLLPFLSYYVFTGVTYILPLLYSEPLFYILFQGYCDDFET